MKKKARYKKEDKDLQELSKSLAEGSPKAIAQMYRIYFHRLCYYGVQVSGKQYLEEVEDVIQDFFMWLAQNYQKVAEVQDLEVYIFQSIRRNLHNKLKSRQQSHKSFANYVERTYLFQENKEYSPEYFHIQLEEQQNRSSYIRAQLEKLPPYQREILYLRYFEDKSYKEISRILSVNEQVAYNYVSRAIKRLKKQFIYLPLLFGLFLFSY